MDRAQIRAAVFATLKQIAPEVASEAIAGDRPLRYQVDLDSMDWLNVILGLHEALGVEIPEADYGKLVTLDGLVDYLGAKLAPAAGPAG